MESTISLSASFIVIIQARGAFYYFSSLSPTDTQLPNTMKLVIASLLFGGAAAFSPSIVGVNTRTTTQLDARRPIISGNWKLNPQTKDEALQLGKEIAAAITEDSPEADVALFVPYVFIESTMGVVDGKLSVGAEVGFVPG